ncbi:MAG: S26 family signal peptidase [Planctomycetota bacterium]|nr:S26 family signal peptidase [Planctomycetota bacterium]
MRLFSNNRKQRKLAILFALVLLTLIAIKNKYPFANPSWLRSHAEYDAPDLFPLGNWFQVSGPSMAPTLYGECNQWSCGKCGWENQFFLYQEREDLNSMMPCASCFASSTQVDEIKNYSGDKVRVSRLRESASQELRRGVLVAVNRDGTTHLKRIVGLPGDRIDLSKFHLNVNSNRIEDLLHDMDTLVPSPWFLVDKDSQARISRWVSFDLDHPNDASWVRTHDGVWEFSGEKSTWLRFSPGLGDPRNIEAPIWDQFHCNVGVERKLFSVDRLRLSGTSFSSCLMSVIFWTKEGIKKVTQQQTASESFSVSCYEADYVPDKEAALLPVDAKHPIAIHADCGRARISGLEIERSLEYRIRPHDNLDQFPIILKPNQYYVLGDNIPLSIDSRDWGPILKEMVVGEIKYVRRGK